jgi:hypothetical protein
MTGAETILGILDEEYRILTGGGYDRLADLVARKEAIDLAAIETSDADPRLLDQIRAASQRNEGILDAARRGIEGARRDIRDARTGATQQTYARDGVRKPLSTPLGQLERKM